MFHTFLLDLFKKFGASCFDKCASQKHKKPNLNLGEIMTCINQCIVKYLEMQERVGGMLQQANEAQMLQTCKTLPGKVLCTMVVLQHFKFVAYFLPTSFVL
jgi:hypothetical protein